MKKIEDLFCLPERKTFAAKPEMDPLTEGASLMESRLIGVRFDAVASIAGLLFDLRQAIQLRLANTGVLIVRGVERLTWERRLHDMEKEMFAEGPWLQERTRWNREHAVMG
ncbi:MAG TPA: hypothetical protein VHJ34_08875 [Actinomycetota bacterium]|nr:hypothetical protein [Actinomycetota bacterium]